MRGRALILCIVGALAALLAPATVLASDETEKVLAEAKIQLRGPGEPVVRAGAEACLKVGDADAMKLLLDVLTDEQPHYRDIVWEVLPKFTDPYARKLVAAKLRAGNTSARVREWCAQALGAYGVSDFNLALSATAGHGDPRVRAAAVRSLGLIAEKSSLARVHELTKDTDPFVRAEAAEAAARIDLASGKGFLWGALRDKDAGTRCATLGVLPGFCPELAEETAVLALADSDWRPRMQAVDNLGALRTKTAVDALVAASGDTRPVVAGRAVAYLQALSGLKYTTRPEWEAWWKANREAFDFAAGVSVGNDSDGGGTTATYNGLPVTSDHVAFVVDRSPDMLANLKNGKSKESAAHEALEATLTALPAGVVFDVVTYGGKTQRFAKDPIALDVKSRAAALKFVRGVKCEGRKDIWEVLETIVSDPTIDTVYLLSSGEPEVGVYVHWNRVTEHLKILNRHHKVTVHAVSYTSSDWFRSQLVKIAECTGGLFAARE